MKNRPLALVTGKSRKRRHTLLNYYCVCVTSGYEGQRGNNRTVEVRVFGLRTYQRFSI